MSEATAEAAPAKKKRGMMKIVVMAAALLLLIGGGVGAGVYAATSGLIGHGGARTAKAADEPQLVPKSKETRLSGSAGEGGGESGSSGGTPTPAGTGGAQYASTYYDMDKDFTSNLQDSAHYLQVGIAVSTPYDQRVIDNLKTHEIAVRSAILMALGDTTEDEVFTSDGKKQLQARLVKAINQVLIEKEGFGGVGNVYFTNFVVQ